MDIAFILIAAFTGLFVKLVDLIEDDDLPAFFGANYLFGVIYGILIGFVISNSAAIAPIWIGAVIGNFLSGKIDAYGHYAGLAAIIGYLIAFRMPELNLILVGVFTAAAITDESLVWLRGKKRIKGVLAKALGFRPILEITALAAAAITGQWLAWLALLAFDLAYNITSIIKPKNLYTTGVKQKRVISW